MRWFIVFLLVANILLFFWVQQEALKQSPQSDIPPPEIGQLRLRNEPPAAEVAAPPEPEALTDDAGVVVADGSSEPAPAVADMPDPLVAAQDDESDAVSKSPAPTEPVEIPATAEIDAAPETTLPVPATESDAPKTAIVESAEGLPTEAEDLAETAVQTSVVEPEARQTSLAPSLATPLSEAEEMAETAVQVPVVGPETRQTGLAPSMETPPADAEDVAESPVQASVDELETRQTALAPLAETPPGEVETVAVQPPSEPEAASPPDREDVDSPPPVGTALPAAAESTVSPPAVCARVGPFEPADADALLARLPDHIELLSDTSEQQSVRDGYYVMIPPLPDRAAGLSKLQELSAAGFEDTWLFRRGTNRNAISLGLFRRQGGAKRQATKVAAKGFDVEVRPRTKNVQTRWLQLKQVGEGDIRGALSLPEGVAITRQDCP